VAGGTVVGALRGGGFVNARIDSDDNSWRESNVACVNGSPPAAWPTWPNCTTTGNVTAYGASDTLAAGSPTYYSTDWFSGGSANDHYKDPTNWPLHIGVLGASADVTSRHTIAVAGQTVWGEGPMSASANSGELLTGSQELECSTCHNQHGNGQYRILRPNPASMIGLTGTFPGGVTVPDACPTILSGLAATGTQATSCVADGVSPGTPVHSYTTTNYMNNTYVPWTTGSGGLAAVACTSGSPVPGYEGSTCPASNLFYPTTLPHIACTAGSPVGVAPYTGAGYICPSSGYFQPNLDGMWPTANGSPASPLGISAWCSQCHQRYLGRSVYDKSSGDAVFTYRHSGEGTLGYNGRQCTTCHVSHGTNAASTGKAAAEEAPGGAPPPAATTWPLDTGTFPAAITTANTANPNSRLLKMDNRGICLKCHRTP
jgi:hypothetical protein